MTITYEIELARELLRTKGTGGLTWDEVEAHLHELAADPRFQRPLDVILDLGECTSLPERNQLEGIANQLKELGGRSRFRRLAVVANRAALYGMMRVFGVVAEEQFRALNIFNTVLEAEAWLRGKPPTAPPSNRDPDSPKPLG
ncbi:MAG TPA: hypothetical protein VEG67_07545 [Myxococcota bacterium]|nr:hypothetical protein [Myxococcota bacterium]